MFNCIMELSCLTKSDLCRLVIVQFSVFAILGVIAFVAWVMAFTHNTSMLRAIVGEYMGGHFVRWTTRFPLWGVLMLVSGVLSLVAIRLLWKSRKEGLYIGLVSFSIAFITNIVFAQNILVHTLIGLFIGWTLLAPLTLLWKNLR